MLTLEQKKQIIDILKDSTDNFVAPMELKIMLPVQVGEEPVYDEEGQQTGTTPIMEDHEFALVNVIITRHDCTQEPKNEYNGYDLISLN